MTNLTAPRELTYDEALAEIDRLRAEVERLRSEPHCPTCGGERGPT